MNPGTNSMKQSKRLGSKLHKWNRNFRRNLKDIL